MKDDVTLRRFLSVIGAVWVLTGLLFAGSPGPRSFEKLQKLIEKFRYSEAESGARELLTEVEQADGKESVRAAEVLDILVEALWHEGKATRPESRQLAERAATIKEKLFGPKDPRLATSLYNLAQVLRKAGDFGGAISTQQRALEIREKTLGPQAPEVADSLHTLAELFRLTSEYARAIPLEERALAIREKVFGPDHPKVAPSLSLLGNLLAHTDDFARALPLHERALAIQEKTLSPDDPDLALTLYFLAAFLVDTGDYARARALHERALAIREKVLGPEHPDVAWSLNDLGWVLLHTGDYAAAKKFHERALAIREKVLGPEHPDVAWSLSNLATVMFFMGEYTTARPLYERALAIREKTLGPDNRRVAGTLGAMAELLIWMGDYAEARPLLERSLAIDEKAFGPEHHEVGTDMCQLANLEMETGNYEEARRLYERALAIQEKALGPDHPDLAQALEGLGGLLVKMGSYAEAKPLFERDVAIAEKALGPDNHGTAVPLQNLADLLVRMGRYAEARPLSERAVAINEKALVPGNPDLAVSLVNLATTLAGLGETRGAFESALRAEEIGRDHLRLTTRALPERQALRYASVRASGLNLALSLAIESPNSVTGRRVWDALVRSRALILDEMAGRHRHLGGSPNSLTARLTREVVASSTQLANLTVRGQGDEDPDRYQSLLEEARREKEQSERALAERSATFRQEQARGRIGFEDVARNLPPDSALVAFVRFDRLDLIGKPQTSPASGSAGEGEKAPSTGPLKPTTSYMAFILRGDGAEVALIPLGTAEEIEGLVSRWSEEAGHGVAVSGRSPEQSEAAYRAAGEAVRRKIWDPIASHLGGAKRVFVVPDGALNLINFAALPVGRKEYVLERGPLLHYLSAERDIVPSGAQQRKGEGLLALGGPAYNETSLFATLSPGKTHERETTTLASAHATRGPDSKTAPESSATIDLASPAPFRGERSGCGDFQSMRFGSLPASEREAEEIIALWKKEPDGRRTSGLLKGDTVKNDSAEVIHLTGASASEAGFKAKAPGRRILHVATHGFFLGGSCASALERSRGIGGLAAVGERKQPPPVTGENPLLLSGLALAGANHRSAAGPDEEDGILTAEEIAAMDLSGVEWAVLSACDTGVGEVKAGEGVFGLRRAFQVAGASTVIMSLWSVEDESAREWMKALYEERLLKHLDTAEAVRSASLKLLQERRAKGESTHPFFWAGFVAAGDWR